MRHPTIQNPWVILSTCLLLLHGVSGAVADAADPLSAIRLVALSDDDFPGVPSGVVVEQFGYPRVDAVGRVTFNAGLLQNVGGTNFQNESAIWSESAPGDLRLVAREGDPVFGLNYVFDQVTTELPLTAGGTSFFLTAINSLTDPPTNRGGIFAYKPNTGLELLAVTSPIGSSPAPVLGGPFSSTYDVNELGEVSLRSSDQIWVVSPGGNTRLVPPIGGNAFAPSLNDLGTVATQVDLENFSRAIYVTDNLGAGNILAREGESVPHVPDAKFQNLAGPFMNWNEGIAFRGGISGTGVNASNDFGIWAEAFSGGPIDLILREGDAAPGTGPGVILSDFTQFSFPIFGRSGGVAVGLGLAGVGVNAGNNSGVWTGDVANGFHLVAREGDSAPGTEPGTVFEQFLNAGATTDGRGVFLAQLRGEGLDPSRDHGLWAEDIDGNLTLIARRGDVMALPDGSQSNLTSVEWDPQFGVSEKGLIAFKSSLASGQQGLFVSELVAVPEPSSLAFGSFLLAGTIACRGRRSSRT